MLMPMISSPLAWYAPVERFELGHFLAARRAPGRPIVDQHDLAAKRCEIEGRPVERFDDEGRSGLTDLRRGARGPGADASNNPATVAAKYPTCARAMGQVLPRPLRMDERGIDVVI